MSLDLALTSPGKQAIRDRLATWFRDRHEEVNLLSLPGKTWEFEKILRPNYVTGLERDMDTYRGALRHAPKGIPHTLLPITVQGFLQYELHYYNLKKVPRNIWNCVWLDYCGPLTEEVIADLHLLSKVASTRQSRVSVAITLLNNRESGNVNDRIEELAKTLKKGKEVDAESRTVAKCILVGDSLSCVSLFSLSWISRYSSGSDGHTGSKMLVIAGTLS
jgi:hypothetical protein